MKNHLQIIARTSIWILAGSVFCIWSCVNSIGGEKEEKTGSVVSGDIPIKVSAKTLHSQIYQKNCNEAIGLPTSGMRHPKNFFKSNNGLM